MAIAIKKSKSNGAVLGLDVSTRTGAVVFDETGALLLANEIVLSQLPKSSGAGPRFRRALTLAQHVSQALADFSIRLVTVEGYAHASPFGMATAVELGTVVRAAAWHAGIPFVEISPSTLKKFATGSGKGGKELVRLGAYKRWQFEHESNNVVDAYVLARIAHALTYRPHAGWLTHADREVLGALRIASPLQSPAS